TMRSLQSRPQSSRRPTKCACAARLTASSAACRCWSRSSAHPPGACWSVSSNVRLRSGLLAQAELETGELGQLVDDRVRNPAPATRAPEPAQLAGCVAPERPTESRARLVAGDVGATCRRARVVETPESGAKGVGVRMPHGGARLVDDRVPCEEHPARPLLVLAHRHVIAKRIGFPHMPWDRGVDVGEERLFEAQLVDAAQTLDARCRPVHE